MKFNYIIFKFSFKDSYCSAIDSNITEINNYQHVFIYACCICVDDVDSVTLHKNISLIRS